MKHERTNPKAASAAGRLLRLPLDQWGKLGKDIKTVAASCLTQAPNKPKRGKR